MATAFTAINLSMLVHVTGSFFAPNYILVLTISVVLWSLEFGLFVIRYISTLSCGRIDDLPG